jgi:hypothetical protein
MTKHEAGPASLTPGQLAQLWAEHLKGEFETKDVEATLATMVEDAYVNHVPVGTGGRGKDALLPCCSKSGCSKRSGERPRGSGITIATRQA